MDQNLNNNQNEFLWTLLANPANDAHLYNYNLQRLVNDFPQSGILQALLAHSSDEKNLRQASVYFNAKSLYKLINAPASFIGVSDEKIIVQNNIPSARFNGSHQTTDTENYFSDHAAVEIDHEVAPFIDHQAETKQEATPGIDEHHITEQAVEASNDAPVEEHHVAEHIEEYEHQPIGDLPVEEHHSEDPAELHEHEPISDIPVEEHHAEEHIPYEHQPTNDLPVEEHHIEETQGELTTEHAEHVVEEPVTETHENWLTEIKDEVVNEIPAAEPIINYAQGLGHKMTPESEEVFVEPASAETEHEAVSDYEAAHEAPSEHPVENNIAEEHVLAPFVAEEHASAEPVIAEYHAFTEPVVEEHKQEEEQPVATDHFATEHTNIAGPVHEHGEEEVTAHAAHTEEPHDTEDKPENTDHDIEDETFDEITGIENIGIENDIISNIAASDFFTFDRAFGAHKQPGPVVEIIEPVNAADSDAEQQDVSKYHDEKLPYSFLWWLDKTRKEHSGIYQPYAASGNESAPTARAKSVTDELQQQYYENIFHITSVEELDKSVPQPLFETTGFEPPNLKEQAIIERFIQEEPQIRPQSSDKLDNENKAKKSSEDRDELVSETLAAIYSDQMLYHKAIASYKKLMLKFPEKSRYFVEKIEQLEKKTN